MPGLLSSVFDGGDESRSTETQAYDAALDAGQDVDVGVDVGLGVEAGGSYQNLDGSTTTWSSAHEVGLDADVDAAADLLLTAGTDQSDTAAEG